jgi:hypothetical protein
VSAESGTMVVNDDQDALQHQTRWNAWLEKGEHTDGEASIQRPEHAASATDYPASASAPPTSSNLTVRFCKRGRVQYALQE